MKHIFLRETKSIGYCHTCQNMTCSFFVNHRGFCCCLIQTVHWKGIVIIDSMNYGDCFLLILNCDNLSCIVLIGEISVH